MGYVFDLLFEVKIIRYAMKDKASQERFFELLEPVYGNLERYALSVAGNREEAKDIVSDTVLIAFENFDKLRSEKAFLSFLFTIAGRVRIDRFRKTKRMESTEPDKFDLLYGKTQSPENYADIKILYRALDKLNPKIREALELYEIMGFSYKEISVLQQTSLSNVKLRIFRGRKKLKKLLEDSVSPELKIYRIKEQHSVPAGIRGGNEYE